jgi:ABC-2 type transport system ATP-binding protein
MLLCRSLTKRFGTRLAVDRLALTLEPGSVVALLGPNGAGKTTCMRLLAGVLEPDEGSIELFGLTHTDHAQATSGMIGYLPEGAPLQPDLTVREHLTFTCAIRGIARSEVEETTISIAQEASVIEYLDTPVRLLSKGYKRRAALAVTLVGGPDLLLLDEPTDGLDPNQKQVTRALLKRLKPGRIIILSTHALDDVIALADRVLVLNDGKLVCDEVANDFLARASNDEAAGGLEAVFAELTTRAEVRA